MKKIKTFEQYHNLEALNEGVITDIFSKFSGKIKELFKSVASKLSSSDLSKISAEVEPYKGMSYDQIKQELKTKIASNESANRILNIIGLSLFSTFASSIAVIVADDKWRFLHKIFNMHDKYGMQNDTQTFLVTGGIAFLAFILWCWVKLDMNEPSYADSTRPSGVSNAERSSSAYIANQMRQRERNAGR